METTISDCHTSFNIPDIQRLDFHLSHVHILVTNICDKLQHTVFKHRELFRDILCRRDYADRVVAIFSHQIQSE